MVKLTLRPGEFIDIGENVRVIFSGGSANNIHLLVDAPREINIARSSAGKKKDTTEPGTGRYYKESGISDEAQKEIVSILMREKRKNAARRTFRLSVLRGSKPDNTISLCHDPRVSAAKSADRPQIFYIIYETPQEFQPVFSCFFRNTQ